jgi:hypothetical protein
MKFSALAAVCALQISHSVAFSPAMIRSRGREGAASIHAHRLPSTSLNNDLRSLAVSAGKPKKTTKKPKKQGVETKAVKSEVTITSTITEKDITEKEVRALFELWNSALATGDSRIVADRYIKRPVLLPTVSDTPRTDFDSVKDYFDAFLKKKPQGKSYMCHTFKLCLNAVIFMLSFLRHVTFAALKGKILKGDIHIGDGWASVRLCYMSSLFAGKSSDESYLNTHVCLS